MPYFVQNQSCNVLDIGPDKKSTIVLLFFVILCLMEKLQSPLPGQKIFFLPEGRNFKMSCSKEVIVTISLALLSCNIKDVVQYPLF